MSDRDEFDPAVLDALALGLPSAAPGLSLRDRLLQAVSTTGRFLPFLDRMMKIFDLPEAQAQKELDTIGHAEEWDDMVPGVKFRDFEGGDGVGDAHGGLVRVEPGHSFPRHSHVGDETLLLLQGRLEDDRGTQYRAGDTLVSPEGSSHEMTVVGDEAVVYAALVVAIEFEGGDDDDFDDDEDLDDFDD